MFRASHSHRATRHTCLGKLVDYLSCGQPGRGAELSGADPNQVLTFEEPGTLLRVHPAPHSFGFTSAQGVLPTSIEHRAPMTDRYRGRVPLGPRTSAFAVGMEEQFDVLAPASTMKLPGPCFRDRVRQPLDVCPSPQRSQPTLPMDLSSEDTAPVIRSPRQDRHSCDCSRWSWSRCRNGSRSCRGCSTGAGRSRTSRPRGPRQLRLFRQPAERSSMPWRVQPPLNLAVRRRRGVTPRA